MIDAWCYLASHHFGTTDIEQSCKKLEKDVQNFYFFPRLLELACIKEAIFKSKVNIK